MRSVVLAVALALLPRPASADRPRAKIAVVPGIVVNLAPARVDALTQELAEALQAELEVEAIGGVGGAAGGAGGGGGRRRGGAPRPAVRGPAGRLRRQRAVHHRRRAAARGPA